MGLHGRYLRYVRDCAHWQVPIQSFEDFQAYWELFAKDGELLPGNAPILVQERQLPDASHQPPAKIPFAGHYQQTSGHQI